MWPVGFGGTWNVSRFPDQGSWMSEYPAGVGAQACSYEKVIHWVLYSNHKLSIHCQFLDVSMREFLEEINIWTQPNKADVPPLHGKASADSIGGTHRAKMWSKGGSAVDLRYPSSLALLVLRISDSDQYLHPWSPGSQALRLRLNSTSGFPGCPVCRQHTLRHFGLLNYVIQFL